MQLDLFGPPDQRCVWRRNNTAEISSQPAVKHLGGSAMLWGCFTSSANGNLQRLEAKMDSVTYQRILGENITLSVRKPTPGCRLTFQQDSDPRCSSTSTEAWFEKKSWKILEWPSQI